MTDQVEPGERAIAGAGATGEVSFPWIVAVLLRDVRTILVVVAAGFILALAAALLRPTYYTSTFSFVPQSGQDQTRSGLASLAGQFGISVGALGGQSQPPQLYADLLDTREILGKIARDTVILNGRERVPLSEFLGVQGSSEPIVLENTIRKLREKVVTASVATRTTGMVTVTARTGSPEVSRYIAQQLLDGLNQFNLETRKSQATEERRFTESRLAEAKASLRASEDALQRFLEGNRQMGGFSQASFQRERLQREVSLQQQIVTSLAQQYEEARIREVRDTPVITLIEKPTLPVLPDPRGRVLTLAMGIIGSLFFGIAIVLGREGWRRQRRNESDEPGYDALSDEWNALRGRFRKA